MGTTQLLWAGTVQQGKMKLQPAEPMAEEQSEHKTHIEEELGKGSRKKRHEGYKDKEVGE